jgi:hypothetical protein
MLVVVMTIDAAVRELVVERCKVREEEDAFEEFERRCSDLSPLGTARPDGGAMQVLGASGADSDVARLREAYEATVMSVEHYQEDYGETLLDHVRTELGEDYATYFGTEQRLTPWMKEAFVMAAADARRRRSEFVTVLDEEKELLDRVATCLDDIRPLPEVSDDTTFDQLRTRHAELQDHERRVSELLFERQEHLHSSRSGITCPNRIDPKSMNQYLYSSLETTYPVLDSVTEFLAQLQRARADVERRISEYYG